MSKTLDNILPSDVTLKHSCNLSITEDKSIMLDYWKDSLDKKAFIGVRENNNRLLVKSHSEYTSSIQKVYKSGNEFIIVTENSIYIVANDIPLRRVK